MIRSRFSVYYQNNPETLDIAALLNSSAEQRKTDLISKSVQSTPLASKKKDIKTECTECEFFQKCVEAKVEKALLCLQRSTSILKNLVSYENHSNYTMTHSK